MALVGVEEPTYLREQLEPRESYELSSQAWPSPITSSTWPLFYLHIPGMEP